MYRIVMATLVFVLFFAAAADAESKFGVINFDYVLQNCEAGQKAMNKLKSDFESLKGDLEKEKAALDAMRQEMEKQNVVMSQEAKKDKAMQFQRKIRDYQDMVRNYQRQMQTQEKDLTSPILDLIVQIVREYGKKEGFTAIFDSKDSGLVFVNKNTDITNAILVEVNKKWRARNK